MSSFELVLKKKTMKPMDLTIPMGQKDHSKKFMEMVKGCEELCAEPKKYWSMLKNSMKNMPTKHKGRWSLRLGNTCG
jgi:hypothetical protein